MPKGALYVYVSQPTNCSMATAPVVGLLVIGGNHHQLAPRAGYRLFKLCVPPAPPRGRALLFRSYFYESVYYSRGIIVLPKLVTQ